MKKIGLILGLGVYLSACAQEQTQQVHDTAPPQLQQALVNLLQAVKGVEVAARQTRVSDIFAYLDEKDKEKVRDALTALQIGAKALQTGEGGLNLNHLATLLNYQQYRQHGKVRYNFQEGLAGLRQLQAAGGKQTLDNLANELPLAQFATVLDTVEHLLDAHKQPLEPLPMKRELPAIRSEDGVLALKRLAAEQFGQETVIDASALISKLKEFYADYQLGEVNALAQQQIDEMLRQLHQSGARINTAQAQKIEQLFSRIGQPLQRSYQQWQAYLQNIVK